MAEWRDHDNLSDRLKSVMSERRITQSELARRSGLSNSYVSMLVLGKRGARLGHGAAASLKRTLRVPDDFFAIPSAEMRNPARG